jgi:hypothetical protein
MSSMWGKAEASLLDCREPRGPYRRDFDFSSTADQASD